MTPINEIARYRAGMADLLAKSVKMTRGIERLFGVTGGWGEATAQIDLDANPTDGLRIECAVLLRKARLHTAAVQHANEAGNLHSLAVQMRPVLECAGQVVFIMHNSLLVGGELGLNSILDYEDANAFRYIIGATKGDVGRKEFREMISSADAKAATLVGAPRIRTAKPKRRSSRQADKVAMLANGNSWYDQLSEHFFHGRTDWKGPSWQGGVISMNTVEDEVTFAVLMDYLVNQVIVMNAYAVLCPVVGDVQHAWVEATLAHLRETREASKALRDAAACVDSSGRDKAGA